MSDTIISTRRARLSILSWHSVIEPEKLGKYASLFDPEDDYDDDGEIAPEDYPDEMNNVLRELREKNGESEEDRKLDESVIRDMCRQLTEFAERMMREGNTEENAVKFCTEAVLREREDGVIEVEYSEDESMDGTVTVIHFDPKTPDSVMILHNGSVMSSLICERRRRHISAYSTPIMPLEVAVYTRSLEGGFDSFGGTMDLDYIVELRGMDIQHTAMKITVDVMD